LNLFGLLAAAFGQIIGVSLSPEIWIAVAFTIYCGTDVRKFLLSWIAGSMLVIATQAFLVKALAPDYYYITALADISSILLWSAIGAWIRRSRSARQRSTIS
jgi:hypothetical protein